MNVKPSSLRSTAYLALTMLSAALVMAYGALRASSDWLTKSRSAMGLARVATFLVLPARRSGKNVLMV